MSSFFRLLSVCSLAALLLACPSGDSADAAAPTPSAEQAVPPVAEAVDPRVVQALAVSASLDERPDTTAEVLAEHELTIERFEALMMQIAADPALSDAYATGRGQ